MGREKGVSWKLTDPYSVPSGLWHRNLDVLTPKI